MPTTNQTLIDEAMFGISIPAAHNVTATIDANLKSAGFKLQFPLDRPKYYTTINFEKQNVGAGQGGIRDVASGMMDALRDYISSGVVGPNSVARGVLDQIPEAIRMASAKATLEIMEQTRQDFTVPTNAAPAQHGQVILPLPVNLIDVHQIKYDEKPILPWASVIPAAIGGILGPGMGEIAQTGVSTVFGLAGLSPNEFYTMLFDRPMFKRHELKFECSPRNFQESTAIRDIINILNNAAAPGLAGGGFLFTFPNVVRVVLRPNDGWLFKFKPCVIESLSFNFVGGDKKAFYRGTGNNNPPESVEFTMNLCEIEYWLTGQFSVNNTGSGTVGTGTIGQV